MSLDFFSLKNLHHKNGSSVLTQVFGGILKSSIESLESKNMMSFALNAESSPTNFTTLDRIFFTSAL